MSLSGIENQILAGRASLKILLKDMNQIFQVGQKVEGGDLSLSDYFKVMVSRLEQLLQEYMIVFKEMQTIAIIGEEGTLFPNDDDIKARNDANSLYYGSVTSYRRLTKEPSPTAPVNQTLPFNQTLSSRSRLPKISLPKFSGSLAEWPKFKQLFVSMIHDNDEIPMIEKFHYLLTSLSGEPVSLIAALTLTETNYPKAWNTLLVRYDNKRLLASSYVDNILDYVPPKGPPSLTSLQSFIRTIAENIAAFQSIELQNESDFLWLSLALRKLDPETRQAFELDSVHQKWPTYQSLLDFLQNRCRVLQLASSHTKPNPLSSFVPGVKPITKPRCLTTMETPVRSKPNPISTCCCNSNHLLYLCPSFRKETVKGRVEFVKSKKLCFNCFNRGHLASTCSTMRRCQTCGGKHHTLLHWSSKPSSPVIVDRFSHSQPPSEANPRSFVNQPQPKSSSSPPGIIANVTGSAQVLLGTAEVLVKDFQGRLQPMRLVIDCGSQFSLITASCARRLGLSWTASRRSLQGACGTPLPKVKGRLVCHLYSKPQQLEVKAEPLVVEGITGNLPTWSLNPKCYSELPVNSLADPLFGSSRPIDFLLGNDLFLQVLSVDTSYNFRSGFGVLSTIFGLVVMGECPSQYTAPNSTCLSISEMPVSNDILSRFWEIEEPFLNKEEHPEDKECEAHFMTTHSRTSDGRYVVALPFKKSAPQFFDSRHFALSRLRTLETKLQRDEQLKEKYDGFLQEYLDLGHMVASSANSSYIIPHHAVFKTNEPNAKIRVVFDASMSTPSGSLNDYLHVGPKLQKDICGIILNFRRHPLAITTDIVKMYRQILIAPEDRRFQHILWRTDPSNPVQTYELRTITYGMTSSPFLALRIIQQLVNDEGASYPLAARALSEDLYVDDVVTGASSLQEAIALKEQLVQLLGKGCFPVHKWASNSEEFLRTISSPNQDTSLSLVPKDDSSTKILGMCWDPLTDCFSYKIHPAPTIVTKRSILSTIARLFDPVGFLAPVIFQAKILLQALWLAKVDWDQTPESGIVENWKLYVKQLPSLSLISIPRCVLPYTSLSTQLVGFSDASQKGFAAAIYLRTVSESGEVKLFLLKAKTKLAPIKSLSIPRLELSAAHLLVRLVMSAQTFTQKLKLEPPLLFSDSTIVLAWLQISPRQLQTFVANRVSYILTHSSVTQWHHIRSEDNPADVASRGLLPSLLQNHSLWWNGPDWIYCEPLIVPRQEISSNILPDLKPNLILTTLNTFEPWLLSWIRRFSSYRHMINSLAYVRRFVSNSRCRLTGQEPRKTELTPLEMNEALQLCVRTIQEEEFKKEFLWNENRPLSKRLQMLDAFLDEGGLLRVGGRLQQASIEYQSKHPLLLPSKTHLVELLIDHYHHLYFHLGPKALQAFLQRHFWIFRLNATIKSRIRKCVVCFKMGARPVTQFMGNLPGSRVTQGRPFNSVGVDYAGPFNIKFSTRRNSPVGKAYLCVFICMVTKAVHLELVSSLATDAFLATLDRFVARRGLPQHLYSDCGLNFVGAARRLRELYTWLRKSEIQSALARYTASRGITWHFNPPYSPHFGGLWEAAVKSTKFHLYRILGDKPLTFEELSTIFVRIEAILNSRPLCPLPTDPDPDFLTPGHFLIGSPLLAIPEQDTTTLRLNSLSRWQLIQNSVQHFWKRWHGEYLQTLQKRSKWFQRTHPMKVGDLVLMYDPHSLPLLWKTARIVETHPGQDGLVRVVTITTPRGLLKRSVHRLIPFLAGEMPDTDSND